VPDAKRNLAELFSLLVEPNLPVNLVMYDGSGFENEGAVGTIHVRSPKALRYIATAPSELGLVRAYVTGEIEIEGDLHGTLVALLNNFRGEIPWGELAAAVRPWMLRRPELPAEEGAARWQRGIRSHTPGRDAKAISHHYDVSNGFYGMFLGPSMTYSCAVFTSDDASLEQAQAEKIDLICRKLGLKQGQSLLDIGAGWGALVRHAAANYGVRATGVTLSREQAAWAQERIATEGLADLAEVRFQDYRDVRESGFDAISSVGAMEHIGSRQLGHHFRSMSRLLRPQGRMLNHTITRTSSLQRHRAGPFIDRYIFPDGELQSPAKVASEMIDGGFELRHEENLREHYGKTLAAWVANLERGWDQAVAEVGERRARVWRLYMTISQVGFERNMIQLHQFLGVNTTADGRAGMPLRPDWGETLAERGPSGESGARR
jgi:cyclopropane-fatty-acyl-phospholipid synthase